MKYFKTEQGKLVNLIEYTLDIIRNNPEIRIYIGSDSQNYSDKTKFVTCICYRWPGKRGVHYIFKKENEQRISDNYTRLYQEGVKTMEVLSEFDDYPIKIESVEFDFNNIKKTISYNLVSTFKGWCEGLGQRAVFKSGELIATKSSDHICRM